MSRKTNRIIKDSVSYKIFIVAAYALILAWSFLCIAPFLNMIAISMSASKYADAFQVGLWPRGFTLAYYGEALTNNQILSSLWTSVKRAILGVVLELFVTMLAAYPMSKDKREFPGRGILSALFIFCMIFSGGLIPNYYLIVNTLNLANTLWALVLPTMLNIGNLILMMNFIRQLPREIEEAALIDGCGYFRTLWKIILPLSVNSILTLTLFISIGHWNSWFDGMIYMKEVSNYPLSTFLYTIRDKLDKVENQEQARLVLQYSKQGLIMTYVVICTLPIILLYPILQKYVKKGLVIGSVKG